MKRSDYHILCALVIASPHLASPGSTLLFCAFSLVAIWKAWKE